MMHNFVKFILNLFTALLAFAAIVQGQVSDSDIETKLWDAIGGKKNWEDARYFMFSCVGREDESFAQGERKYLWDKKTGSCRFEGITTDDEAAIVLFNTKTAEGTVYINGVKLDNPRTTADVIAEVSDEFEKDAYLLFLPTALCGGQASYTVTGEKLVGTQRLVVINIKNPKTSFETPVEGQLYVDLQTGQAKRWRASNNTNHFTISGFKDIGGGLVLPTRFTGSDASTSITYPIAAALVNIEEQKFIKP
ncbi:hypothetical protein ACFOET_14245 [Parapedobacter deserti]|uniref:Uncharacterized protein n=2 Tax=Parapedobacter deserti TaxID=1912957 RepID=A0ABV7JPM6_9SPHI